MEDIIEIYDPIYRESMNFTPIIIIVLSILLIFAAIVIFRKVKQKKSIITPEQRYQKALDDYLELQKEIDSLSSYSFSNRAADIFKSYLSEHFLRDYKSTTTHEMINQMNRDSNHRSEVLEQYFEEKLKPAQYGKLELESTLKNEIVRECVDYISELYSETGESLA